MIIDEKTKISLFAVFVALPFIIGGVLWFTAVEQKASAAQSDVQSLKPLVEDILIRVIRIEEQLKTRR